MSSCFSPADSRSALKLMFPAFIITDQNKLIHPVVLNACDPTTDGRKSALKLLFSELGSIYGQKERIIIEKELCLNV